MSNLMEAAQEWQSRPADERFADLGDLYLHCLQSAMRGKETTVETKSLRVAAEGGALRLLANKRELAFNNWSFGQMARKVGAPADWLRRLPTDLVVKNMNWGFENSDNDTTQLWFDDQKVRAATGNGYTRILNHEVVKAVIDLGDGWVTPPARPAGKNQPGARIATAADILKQSSHPDLGIKVGDWIAPAGIYGGDRNIFIFQVNPDIQLDDGTDHGLRRGFFVRNSEVGDASFELTAFWYRYVCGNHIVWDAVDVSKKKIKHIGRARSRAFDSINNDLDDLAKTDLSKDAAFISRAKNMELGKDKDEVVENLYSQQNINRLIGKRRLGDAFDMAEANEKTDGIPTTVWGLAQGITRVSQSSMFADERTTLDKAAGEILALANN